MENEENIVLVDEQGLILNEFHSDGYAAGFVYAKTYFGEPSEQLVSITISLMMNEEMLPKLMFIWIKSMLGQRIMQLQHPTMRKLCR